MASRSLGTLTIDLVAKIAGFESGMTKAERIAAQKSRNISRSIETGLKSGLAGITGFVGGIAAGLLSAQAAFQGFANSINTADKLDELSNRLGITTEQLSAWGYAAKLSGTDIDSLAGSIQKFSKTVANAADPQSDSARLFSALGIQAKDAQGNLRDIEQLLPEVADRFKQLKNDTTEAALAQELFGRSGAELLEFLNRGSAGIGELTDEASRFGAIIDSDVAQAAAKFNDQLDKMKALTNAFFLQVANELLPSLTRLVTQLSEVASENNRLEKSARVLGKGLDIVFNGYEIWTTQLRITSAILGTQITALSGYYSILKSIVTLDFGGIKAGFGALSGVLRAGYNMATGDSIYPQSGRSRARNPRGGSLRPETGTNFASLDESINAYLSRTDNPTRNGTGNATKSRTEEVDKLTQAYERMKESLEQQYILFGKTTEEAKIRYELEYGELQKLTQARKDELIVLSQRNDVQRQTNELQEAADEAVRREQEAISEGRVRTEELIADMEFENALLMMNNEERARAVALRYADANATDEQRQRIAELSDQYQEGARTAELWDEVQRGIGDAISDIVSGSKSAKDAITDFFDALNQRIVQMIAEGWAEKIADLFKSKAGASSGGSGGGGWIEAIGQLFGSFAARANGGPVTGGQTYLVGERGPELFTAPKSGTIIPNERVGTGMTVQQNFYNPIMSDRRSDSQRQAQAAQQLRTATARNG